MCHFYCLYTATHILCRLLNLFLKLIKLSIFAYLQRFIIELRVVYDR